MSTPRSYLDCNATTCIDPEVLEVYTSLLKEVWGNPSSTHREGQRAKSFIVEAKDRIKKALNAPPHYDVLFFSSATEAINTLLKGVVSSTIREKKLVNSLKSFLTTEMEHAAVYETVKCFERTWANFNVKYLPPNLYGAPSLQDVERAVENELQSQCSLLGASFMAVNNETGVITDELPRIASLLQSLRIPLIVDGVALLGKAPIDFYDGISALIFSGHKIHAPKGIGFALVDKRLRFDPLIVGGPQESGKRAGTENPPLAGALAFAVEKTSLQLSSDLDYMRSLQQKFEERLISELTADVCVINGEGKRVPSTSNIAFLGVDGEDLLFNLDLKGVSASHGSACSSGALEPSRVLLKMGYSHERASSSLRFSISRLTTEEEIEKALKEIVALVKAIRKKT